MEESVIIDGLPEYPVIGLKLDWLLKELRVELKITQKQYDVIKANCSISLPSLVLRIGDLQIVVTNKLAKMLKLVVHKTNMSGEFSVPFIYVVQVTEEDK